MGGGGGSWNSWPFLTLRLCRHYTGNIRGLWESAVRIVHGQFSETPMCVSNLANSVCGFRAEGVGNRIWLGVLDVRMRL